MGENSQKEIVGETNRWTRNLQIEISNVIDQEDKEVQMGIKALILQGLKAKEWKEAVYQK